MKRVRKPWLRERLVHAQWSAQGGRPLITIFEHTRRRLAISFNLESSEFIAINHTVIQDTRTHELINRNEGSKNLNFEGSNPGLHKKEWAISALRGAVSLSPPISSPSLPFPAQTGPRLRTARQTRNAASIQPSARPTPFPDWPLPRRDCDDLATK